MTTPPLHAEVRAELREILTNWASGEFPDMNVESEICQAVADALLARLPPKKSMDPAYKTGSDAGWGCTYGFNECLDAVTRVIGELRGDSK